MEITGVFDIECANWNEFVVGGISDVNGYRAYDWRDDDAFIDDILSTDGTLWAHNGGHYDALWLLREVKRRGFKISNASLQGSRLLSFQVADVTIRDSFALIPMSLADGAGLGGRHKVATGLPCRCGENCGGYCSISRRMPAGLFRQLCDYLENDCKVTHRMLEGLARFAEDNDLTLASTVGQSSWLTAKRWLELPDADWEWGFDYALSASHGGRVQCFRPRVEAGFLQDINAAYPYALTQVEVPYGTPKLLYHSDAALAFGRGQPAIYAAHVRVPEDIWIPPLPVRLTERVAYPVGEFSGRWPANELAAAEEAGVEILSIDEAMVWPSSGRLLAPFCETVWKLRARHGKDSAEGRWLKWFANSITGKFAQRREHEMLVIDPTEEDLEEAARLDRPFTPLDDDWEFCTRPTFYTPSCAHVQWAVFLRASTRIQLRKQLVAGGDDAVYCDTDSVFSVFPREVDIGPELGQWEREPFSHFECLAPKTYRYEKAGRWKTKSKGLAKFAVGDWASLRAGASVVNNRGVQSLKMSLRTGEGLFARKSLSRRVDPAPREAGWYGDRILCGDVTMPVTLERLREDPRGKR